MTTLDCGHGCSITCPDGGGCIYWHDTGRCDTFCSYKGRLEYKGDKNPRVLSEEEATSVKVEVSFKDITISDLQRLLGSLGTGS